MSPLRYLPTYLIPACALITLFLGGWYTLVLPAVIFGFIPLCELCMGGTEENPSRERERSLLEQRIYDWILYGMVPAQYAVVLSLIYLVSSGQLIGWEILGGILAVGTCCGGLGINIAHELGHRRRRYEQCLAKLLLLTSLYQHFFIEHNRGHHARVATKEDPASARYRELLYSFWLRSVCGGMLGAWTLEKARLERRNLPLISWQNEALRLFTYEAMALTAVLCLAGPLATLAFLASALTGILMRETVIYIEHYGLSREKGSNGKYESVKTVHSWNSNHTLGRGILFELTRHSDHHANPQRKYQVLRHFDESPQLPTGYPGMMVLSLVPPVFFWVMDRRLLRWQNRQSYQYAG
jgi:alkane 1-monooxygenase